MCMLCEAKWRSPIRVAYSCVRVSFSQATRSLLLFLLPAFLWPGSEAVRSAWIHPQMSKRRGSGSCSS